MPVFTGIKGDKTQAPMTLKTINVNSNRGSKEFNSKLDAYAWKPGKKQHAGK